MRNNHSSKRFKLNFYSKARGFSPKLLFLITPIYLTNAYASVVRHDIDYREYIKFGNNAGKYEAGATDVKVYKKDGTLSTGNIEGDGKDSIPLMPNFYSVSDKGYATPVSHNIVVTAAHMVDMYSNESYGKRFYRTDISLFKNSITENDDDDQKEKNYLAFIFSDEEVNKKNYDYGYAQDYNQVVNMKNLSGGYDASYIRTKKLMFDVEPYELKEFSGINVNDLLARNGAGAFSQAIRPYEQTGNPIYNTYTYVHGGLAQVKEIRPEAKYNLQSNHLSYQLWPEAKNALDSTSRGGDSGSPVFWWDKENKKWWLLGVNSRAGRGALGRASGYGKEGIMESLPRMQALLTEMNYKKEVGEGNTITITTAREGVNKAAYFKVSDGNTFKLYTTRYYGGDRTLDKESKDLYLTNSSGGSIELNINGDTDIGSIPIYFETDAKITGAGKFDLSGMSVGAGKTVTAELTLVQGTDWRKVGAGTLRLSGKSAGKGSVAIGDGTLELNTDGGIAAEKIMLATGKPTVKLLKDGQFNTDKIYFGVRGGALDLNGYNAEFENIYHMDRGANIKNDNKAKKSVFTFKPTESVNYLGQFNGNLDLTFKPNNKDTVWILRGDSKIDGDVKIENGTFSLNADRLIYSTMVRNGIKIGTTLADYNRREWRPHTFQAKNITVGSGATLGVGRASTLIAEEVKFSGNNKFNIEISDSDSKRHDPTQDAIKGDKFSDPTFHNPKVQANLTFTGSNNQVKFNMPKDFTATFEGSMSGAADIITQGEGSAVWKNTKPTNLTTKISAKTALLIENTDKLNLTLKSNGDNFTLNNKKEATFNFMNGATQLTDKVRLNLENGSHLTLSGLDNVTKRNVIINADIQRGTLENSYFPTITLANGATTFNFKQRILDTNLILNGGALGLFQPLTVAGDFSSSNSGKIDFGTIDDIKTKSENGSYELNNKLTIDGSASGVVTPIFTLSDTVTAKLANPVNKLVFVDYKTGSLQFESAVRTAKNGLEFDFTFDRSNTYLMEKEKIVTPAPVIETKIDSTTYVPLTLIEPAKMWESVSTTDTEAKTEFDIDTLKEVIVGSTTDTEVKTEFDIDTLKEVIVGSTTDSEAKTEFDIDTLKEVTVGSTMETEVKPTLDPVTLTEFVVNSEENNINAEALDPDSLKEHEIQSTTAEAKPTLDPATLIKPTTISLTAKTAPEVGEYLTLIGSARNVLNINLNTVKEGFSVQYENYAENDNYRHLHNFNSKVRGNGVVFNAVKRQRESEFGLQARMADLNTTTSSDKVRLSSKTKLVSAIAHAGYEIGDFKFYGALGVAKARFKTNIDADKGLQANNRSINNSFNSTGVFAKGGVRYRQTFGNISLREYVALSYNNLGLGTFTDSNGDKVRVKDSAPFTAEAGIGLDYQWDKWQIRSGIGASYDLGKLKVSYVDIDREYTRGLGKLKLNLDLGLQYQLMNNLYLTQDTKIALQSKGFNHSLMNIGVRFTW
ncbi:S6 family peptidase [Testudinibacter sp. P80/BLE/0925]|uniref:S6 family peptidase n=1 Tax=Testudinibacter sp. TW-1 TaxID=3417757 RepID=UPI003D36C3D3